jgi:hypothetical protein
MKNFTSTDSFHFVSQRDITTFFGMLCRDSRFKNTNVYVGSSSEIEDSKNPLMTYISINFQTFKGKKQEMKKYQWNSYRAKDFCCSSSDFKTLKTITLC